MTKNINISPLLYMYSLWSWHYPNNKSSQPIFFAMQIMITLIRYLADPIRVEKILRCPLIDLYKRINYFCSFQKGMVAKLLTCYSPNLKIIKILQFLDKNRNLFTNKRSILYFKESFAMSMAVSSDGRAGDCRSKGSLFKSR